ncbi:N-acetylglucosamine-6-phosphate deacetylase [Calorimonas adulescens]|jgi:N-acetylglucosamine-6-phosphate deacetylase|uniref:N-acetylglucosamine-6-phosphate deacetylase n=1 Tax=Calorimonas adulescens TaxID=2606906 RepID=A0A5D8QFH4_9THEO|nr:N-acetylglucosamine-6-phosphate deacetylase [Calorimonas adulescens]TZE82949.1 N-acetylglucosamine-6-phosphate deacetylase [Calorimonas adulescens]
MFAITNGRVIAGSQIVDSVVIVDKDRIVDLRDAVPVGIRRVDARGMYVSPGFIEIHMHGRNGYDTMDASFDAINGLSKALIASGVTGFLATTMTMPGENIKRAVRTVGESMGKVEGARLLGLHMEGPFISKEHKGAQPEDYIKMPSMDEFMSLCDGFDSIVKLITVAPETDGAVEFIRKLANMGTVISMGHTNATYDEAMKGIKAGAKSSTHTFNGMRGFHHREPGALGAVFDSDIFAEFICDGVHVHFAALRTLLKIKGVERSILVTDSMRAAGLADGVYDLGGQQVFVKSGQARLADGTIAGSTLTLDAAVHNAVEHLGVTIPEAVRMASYNPAKLLGLNDMGEIKKGNMADIIFFDEDINIKGMFIAGDRVF